MRIPLVHGDHLLLLNTEGEEAFPHKSRLSCLVRLADKRAEQVILIQE